MLNALIVDDSSTMRRMLSNLFKDMALNVVATAASGEEGVELYEQHKPDFVTMDVNMPGISGVEALKQIRDKHTNANILMLSSRGDDSIVVESIKYGAKGYLLKPLNRVKIEKAITNIFPNAFKNEDEIHIEDSTIENFESTIKDSLTNLYTVQYMHQTIQHLVEMHDRNEEFAIGLLIVNVSNLEKIIEEFGPAERDVILVQVAEEIDNIMRSTDFPIRLNNNEFAIFVLGKATQDMIIIANRLKFGIEAIQSNILNKDTALQVSIGMAIHKQKEKLIAYIERTDNAVKEAIQVNETRIQMSK